MALPSCSGLTKGLLADAAVRQLIKNGIIPTSSTTPPLIGFYGHRDGAIGATLAAALRKKTYGTDPVFLVST